MEDYRSFNAVRQDLEQKKITCVDLVQHYVLKINATKDLNAFIEVFEESAKEKAQKVDLKIKNGTAGKLAGLILSIKDNICYKGHGVSAASKILENFESIYNATVDERLLEEDAIIIGRTNCDEFAMGSSNENSFYGAVKHPFIEGKVPGGSSGGLDGESVLMDKELDFSINHKSLNVIIPEDNGKERKEPSWYSLFNEPLFPIRSI